LVKVRLDARVDKELAEGLDELVRAGRFKARDEAVAEALRLLIRANGFKALVERMSRVTDGAKGYPRFTEALEEAGGEDDGARERGGARRRPHLKLGLDE